MTGDIVALRPSDTVSRAAQILTDTALHLLPVIEQAEVVGAITLADCHGLSPTTHLSDAIRRPPITADGTLLVTAAAALMRAEGVHHLLVTEEVAGTKELVGVLSSLDLLRLLTD